MRHLSWCDGHLSVNPGQPEGARGLAVVIETDQIPMPRSRDHGPRIHRPPTGLTVVEPAIVEGQGAALACAAERRE